MVSSSQFQRHDENFQIFSSATVIPRRRHDVVFFVIVTLTGFATQFSIQSFSYPSFIRYITLEKFLGQFWAEGIMVTKWLVSSFFPHSTLFFTMIQIIQTRVYERRCGPMLLTHPSLNPLYFFVNPNHPLKSFLTQIFHLMLYGGG